MPGSVASGTPYIILYLCSTCFWPPALKPEDSTVPLSRNQSRTAHQTVVQLSNFSQLYPVGSTAGTAAALHLPGPAALSPLCATKAVPNLSSIIQMLSV